MANLRVNKITSTETFEKTGSVQFGNDNALKIAANSDFDLTSNDFTMECWVYMNSVESFQTLLLYTVDSTEDDTSFQFDITSTQLRFVAYVSNSSVVKGSNFSFAPGTWYHVAATRTNDLIRLFVDGDLIGTHPFASTIDTEASAELNIGYRNNNGTMDREVFGHLTNVRIINGKALYTANFKPSMRELEVTPETVLLACQSKTDASHEKTGKTITVLGDAVASELTPGILTPIPKAGAGSAITGSVEFTSTTDALVLSAGEDFAYGTGDFTIEAWIQPQGTPSGETKAIFTQTQSGNDYIVFKVDSDKAIKATFGSTTVSGGTVEVGSWHHVAVTRASNTVKIFVNGVASAGTTVSTDFSDTTRNPTIGQYTHTYGNIEYYGFISNLRVVKGTALYTDSFTPPTRELKKVPGTVLLCCQDENSVTTEATGKTITVNGDPAASNFTPQVGDDRSVILNGVTNMNTENYFYLPTGDTVTRDSRSGRGVFGGGNPGTASNVMQYVQIQSQGNALDFGDLTVARQASGLGSATRGVFGGNAHPNGDTMDFITIASTGNAIDFGNLQSSLNGRASAASSTRGIFAGGGTPSVSNEIDFITIATTGNATDFGNLTAARRNHAGVASPIRAAFAGGDAGPTTDTIDFITIASTGNAVDFGNLSAARETAGGASSSTRGVFMGGYTSPGDVDVIEYITIASKGNAKDFGNLSAARRNGGSVSNNIRGLYAGGHPSVNTIEFVTIASTGDANDFGDLLVGQRINPNHVSDSHGGLG
jgi:hypothetical protein